MVVEYEGKGEKMWKVSKIVFVLNTDQWLSDRFQLSADS